MKMNVFLRECRSNFNKLNKTSDNFLIITGNQSCDLDSIVSAIAYSYYKHIKDQQLINFPILNTTKEIFRLKEECGFLFDYHSINVNHLIFIDELSDYAANDFKIALVDHNTLDPKQMSLNFDSKVTEIIDHHQDEHKFMHASPRLIDNKCVSNALLIAELFYNDKISINSDLASFLLFAILIDSSKMCTNRKRIREIDDVLFKFLMYNVSNDFKSNYHDIYTRIVELKENLSNKSLMDIFENDFKQWTVHNSMIKYGISSIRSTFNELLTIESPEELIESIKKIMLKHQIDAQFLLISSKAQRELVMFSCDSYAARFVDHNRQYGYLDMLKYEKINENLTQIWFKCTDSSETRKIWQPRIDAFFKQ